MTGRLIVLLVTAAARADEPRDLAADVRAVFVAKCAVCHGPDVKKPKGRFGYVTDLVRVAANRELVIPGAPDESELWELIRRGEMPPADASTGALTAEQKATVRAWIAAGAPVKRRAEPERGP
jgi:mono/diheme cytochrome c family protein